MFLLSGATPESDKLTARGLAVTVRQFENRSIAVDFDQELPIWFWFTLLQAHGDVIVR